MADRKTETAMQPQMGACNACLQPIILGARVCHHCGSPQTHWKHLGDILKWIAGAVTVLSLLFGIYNLNGLYQTHLEKNEAILELVGAAERLGRAGDYRRAWMLYEQALALEPSSAIARKGQVELALRWLPNARTVGEESFLDIVDPTLPVLARGVAASKGRRAGDLLAVLGWAHYLERKEKHISDIDIPGLYAEALQEDDNNVYAHTFLGHWLFTEDRDLQAGLPHFQWALDTGREREFVRRFQFASLENLLRGTRPESDVNIQTRRELLRMANDMRRNQEPSLHERQRMDILKTYGRRFDGGGFAEMLSALPPDDHLALIPWLLDGFDDQQLQSGAVLQARFVMARIQEEQGDRIGSLSAYRALHPQVSKRANLRKPLDGALERLSGSPTEFARERNDPLGYHADVLRTSDPTSEEFNESFRFLGGTVRAVGEGRELNNQSWAITTSKELKVRLADWTFHQEQGEQADKKSPEDIQSIKRHLQVVRENLGSLYLTSRNLDFAIQELEGLTSDLDPGTSMRRGALYNLACAYSLRSEVHGTEPGAAALREADIDRGIERLDRAIKEGYSNWDHIKRDSDLNALREHRRYVELLAGR